MESRTCVSACDFDACDSCIPLNSSKLDSFSSPSVLAGLDCIKSDLGDTVTGRFGGTSSPFVRISSDTAPRVGLSDACLGRDVSGCPVASDVVACDADNCSCGARSETCSESAFLGTSFFRDALSTRIYPCRTHYIIGTHCWLFTLRGPHFSSHLNPGSKFLLGKSDHTHVAINRARE